MPRQKKVKLIGLGVPANLLKEFIDLSYKGNTSIAPAGYEIDTPLSDSRVKVYKKPNSKEVIVVHRGSVGLQDWLDNAKFLVAGKVKSTKTYKMHRDRHLKAVEKYGAENIIGIGHSRAGLYLQELQKEVPIKEIITYNKAVGFYDALRENPAEQTDVKVKNDIVSLLSGLQKRKNKIVQIEATENPLDLNKAHQPAELVKLGETFIGLKEDEKPMEGSGRAPSPKTLDQLKKILKTLEGKLEKINKGKVYKTTNKDKVSYDISYTKARIKNHETNGEDLIITKKAKYGNELPKKAKPYKAKPKKEPKKEEPKKEEPKKEEPKKEEPKKKEPKKKEDIKKEDFKDMWDYYSALWYIPNPNRPNKGARYNFYNDFNDNIIKLGSIENPRKTTHKGFEEITNKEALSILIELRERMENYLKTGDYGKYYTLAEVKKLLEMIEKPIEEHTKYLNKKKEPKKEEPKKEEPKKEEPITNPKLAKIEEFINDTENYINKKSTRAFNAFMKKYDDKNFIKSIIGAQKFSDFYPTSQKCLSNYKPYLKNISEDDIILEPTAGLGSIVLWLLKNNVKSKIIATDFDPAINNYLKESFAGINQVSILEHSKSDYLDMNNNYYKYNPSIIFLNPPFSNKGDKKYYLNFLFKALYDLQESDHPWREHQLFFISPQLTNSNEKNDGSIDFEKIVMSENKKKEIKKMLNINDEEEWENLMPDQVVKVATCNDFGGTKMEATLYHIITFGNPSKKEEPKKEEPKKKEPKKEEPKKEEPKPAPTPKKEEPKPVLELPTPDPTPKKIEPLINKLENKIEEFEKVGREHGAVIYQAGTFIQVVAYIALLMEYEAKCAILGDKGEHKIKINSKLRSPMNKEFYENAEKLSGDLLDCIEREDKLIAIPLSLAFGSSPDGHANLLIYRPFEKTIERFEPHGSRYGGKNGKEADEVFNSVLKKMFEVEMKPYLKEYTPKFISPDQICPNPKGFQALEAEVANLKQEGGGFCGMWSLFILELLFINPTKPTAEIIKEALAISKEDPQYLRNVIRGYVKKTERLLDDYVKKIDANEGFTFAKGKDLKGKQVAFQEKLLELLLSFGGKNSQVKELQTEITTKKEQKNKYKDLIALIETKSINEINNMMQKVYDSHGFRGKNWTMTSIINNIIKKQEDLEGAPDNLQYKKQKMIFDFFNEPMPKKEEPKPEPKKEEPKKEEPKRGEAPFKGASKKHRNFELEFIFKEVKENLERINAFKEKMKTKGFLKYIPENRNGYMTQVLNIIDVLGEFDISLGKGDDWQKTQQINRLKKYYRSIFNGFIERNYPSEKRMSLSFIPLYDNELAELKTYLKKHDLKLPNLTDLFSEVKKYDDDANAEEKAKIEGGIFGFSAEEKEARKKRNAEKRAEIDAQKKKRAEKLKELREALNAIKKKKQEKKEAETKAEEIVEAPKAEEDAEQEVTITEPNIEGSGYKKSYVEEIAKPTNPMFAFKSSLSVPMFIEPENEYLISDENYYGGSATDMLGMNCYDGKCFNPVWEKEKIKRQILSEYKIWYWPWGTPPAGHIRMPWLNAMVEERYKPLYDEFVARRNVNIGLDANASKDDFGRQMFSNLTDALSYVPVLNLPTTIGLSVASAVSDIKKEPVEPIDTD